MMNYINTITDFMFNHAYAFINGIVVINGFLLLNSLIESAQDEIECLVEFYEEEGR